MSETLKPCPICEQTMCYFDQWTQIVGPTELCIAIIRCPCGMQGPEYYGGDRLHRAIAHWNTRTNPREARLVQLLKEARKDLSYRESAPIIEAIDQELSREKRA